MTNRSIGPLLCGGLLTLAVLMPSTAPAAPTVVTCSPKSLKIMASTLLTTTTSTSYVDINQAAVNFKQGGTSPSCVVVRFSAAASSKQDAITVRPLRDDGVPQ
jgi:hypothetical protein